MELPVFPFVPVASCPVTGCYWEESGSFLTLPYRSFTHISKITLELSLLQTRQSQFSQLLLVSQMLQSLNHLCGPLLESLLDVLCPYWTGEPKTGPSTWFVPHQGWAEGKNHLPRLVNALPNAEGVWWLMVSLVAFSGAGHPPACAAAWDYSSPGVELRACLPWGSRLPVSPAFLGPFERVPKSVLCPTTHVNDNVK